MPAVLLISILLLITNKMALWANPQLFRLSQQLSQCVDADCSRQPLVVGASDSSPRTPLSAVTTLNFKPNHSWENCFNVLISSTIRHLYMVSLCFSCPSWLLPFLPHTPAWCRHYMQTRHCQLELSVFGLHLCRICLFCTFGNMDWYQCVITPTDKPLRLLVQNELTIKIM